jgi:alkanesulfonate monooxygenase
MLRYYDMGITRLVLKGFDPLDDVIDMGKRLVPLLREGAEQRDLARV